MPLVISRPACQPIEMLESTHPSPLRIPFILADSLDDAAGRAGKARQNRLVAQSCNFLGRRSLWATGLEATGPHFTLDAVQSAEARCYVVVRAQKRYYVHIGLMIDRQYHSTTCISASHTTHIETSTVQIIDDARQRRHLVEHDAFVSLQSTFQHKS